MTIRPFLKWFMRDRWNFFDLLWIEVGARTIFIGHPFRAMLIMILGAWASGMIVKALGAGK